VIWQASGDFDWALIEHLASVAQLTRRIVVAATVIGYLVSYSRRTKMELGYQLEPTDSFDTPLPRQRQFDVIWKAGDQLSQVIEVTVACRNKGIRTAYDVNLWVGLPPGSSTGQILVKDGEGKLETPRGRVAWSMTIPYVHRQAIHSHVFYLRLPRDIPSPLTLVCSCKYRDARPLGKSLTLSFPPAQTQ